LECARDVEVLKLAEEMDPGVQGGEEEAQLGEVELDRGLRIKGDGGDVGL
jgi:hypothetical protein